MTDYGILGVGAIAEAIVTGACSAERPPTILLSPRSAARGAALSARFGSVGVAADNQAVVDGAEVVVLALRPQDAEAALCELTFPSGQPVISVMAGISLDDLGRLVAPARAVARAIPLPSVGRRAGVTPIHPPDAEARKLFDPLGGVLEIADAGMFEAIAASTATIAAHFEYLEEIARWLAGQGVSEHDAARFVASVFGGVGESLRGGDFASLAQDYATPGGLNEQFATALREAGSFDVVARSLDDVLRRLLAPLR